MIIQYWQIQKRESVIGEFSFLCFLDDRIRQRIALKVEHGLQHMRAMFGLQPELVLTVPLRTRRSDANARAN